MGLGRMPVDLSFLQRESLFLYGDLLTEGNGKWGITKFLRRTGGPPRRRDEDDWAGV